ncbi:RES domain-containing protein [Microlunatus elymi]|uniref:RES domain-containing protein n=1 Tax=Microlunatus elymi TaxID=2596828 RepID=A0A516PWV7_9ACTN|nr:RES family NAD+ phosphorylase [Microlunatus elymi]QDP95666.1 RES domain-containing protein [Microlunatus elymi]
MKYPPQDLACPSPRRCPVVNAEDLPHDLPVVQLPEGSSLHRVYDGAWGYDEPNPGFGDARFSPFDALDDGRRVPALYAAETPTGALLETIFHDVHQTASRLIYESDLREQLLAYLRTPSPLSLVDLRDPILTDAGIARGQFVSSPAEHYPCTRRIAQHLHRAFVDPGRAHGLMWHSRQAELGADEHVIAVVVYADSYQVGRGGWRRIGPGSRNLLEGEGRLQVDAIANQLGATIVAR